MGLFNKLLGYRWSLYIVKHGNEIEYVMHENSVIRIAGYVMSYYKNGATPHAPWSLRLNFNKKQQAFELNSNHFTPDGENITNEFIRQIETIDPGYRVSGSEPVFIKKLGTLPGLICTPAVLYSSFYTCQESLA